jgi:hypothetical protein
MARTQLLHHIFDKVDEMLNPNSRQLEKENLNKPSIIIEIKDF